MQYLSNKISAKIHDEQDIKNLNKDNEVITLCKYRSAAIIRTVKGRYWVLREPRIGDCDGIRKFRKISLELL